MLSTQSVSGSPTRLLPEFVRSPMLSNLGASSFTEARRSSGNTVTFGMKHGMRSKRTHVESHMLFRENILINTCCCILIIAPGKNLL